MAWKLKLSKLSRAVSPIKQNDNDDNDAHESSQTVSEFVYSNPYKIKYKYEYLAFYLKEWLLKP